MPSTTEGSQTPICSGASGTSSGRGIYSLARQATLGVGVGVDAVSSLHYFGNISENVDFASECFNMKGYERCLFKLIMKRIFEVSYSFVIVLDLLRISFRLIRAMDQCPYISDLVVLVYLAVYRSYLYG